MRKIKKVEDSLTENSYFVRPRHINSYGRLFGGTLMQWIDEVAGMVARRHSGCIVTTACIDNLIFKEPVYQGALVVLIGKLTYVGNSSMEIRVDSYAETADGTRRMINRAYEVMVALDQDNHKVEVPALMIQNETEKAEWEGGQIRYALRRERRKKGY